MNLPAISVDGLGKWYRIGARREASRSLRDSLRRFVRSPVRNIAIAVRGTLPGERLWALKDLTFDVPRGEVLGIIGRNGAGKSTLLKILSRITEPSAGRATIRGRVGSLLEVGTGFHPELTGRENIFLNGAVLGMTREEIAAKFDRIVAFAEINRFLDTPVKRYSSGMYVRLAFAVAAHLEPEILLVDEVLAVGDASFQRRCLGKMGDVARSGRTVLFVSHNMLAVQSLCTRAIVLDSGRLVFEGAARDAVTHYLRTVEDSFETDLGAREDRQGGEDFRFLRVEFIDSASETATTTLISGSPVRIRIHYECRAPDGLDDVGIGIAFATPDGGRMFTCRSRAIGRVLRLPPGRGATECVLDRWPLKAGRYVYDLFAEKGERPLDWVTEAGVLTTEAGDYYGTGIIPAPGQPGVFVDYRWENGGTDPPGTERG